MTPAFSSHHNITLRPGTRCEWSAFTLGVWFPSDKLWTKDTSFSTTTQCWDKIRVVENPVCIRRELEAECFMKSRMCENVSCSVVSLYEPMDCSSLGFSVHGFLWDSPGKNTGVGCHSLLLGIVLTQGSNPGLLHCRQILYRLSHWGSPLKSGIEDNFIPLEWFPSTLGIAF